MNADISTDLIVFGSGPAGCAVAIASKSHGLDVVVIERSDGTEGTVGEHLSPEGVVALRAMGLGALIASPEHAPCPFIESAWGEPDLVTRDYMTSPHGSGINLDRPRFDAGLRAQAIGRGVRILNVSYAVGASPIDTGWVVPLAGDAKGLVVHARFLVDATGRTAWLTRRLGAKIRRFDRLAAIIGILEAPREDKGDNGRLLIEATEAGWWYSVQLASGRTVASWMSEANMIRHGCQSPEVTWHKRLALAPCTAARCAGRILAGPVQVKIANSQLSDRIVGDAWLATGDAAQAYAPFSSKGISKGLRHGAAAADAVVAHLQGDKEALQNYSYTLARNFLTYLETKIAYYRMEQRWPDAPFWQVRHSLPSRLSLVLKSAHEVGV